MSEQQRVSKYRQRIMDDRQVQYVYSEKRGTIHHKGCYLAKRIPDTDLFYTQEYMPELKQCPKCAFRSYILSGSKDPYNIAAYEKLFSKMRANLAMITQMYREHEMETRINGNALTIWDRDDVWKIVLVEERPYEGKGRVRLLHNNYHVDDNGKRVFDHGFHVQSNYTSCTNFQTALNTICTYSFRIHQRDVAKEEQLRAASIAEEQRESNGWLARWKRRLGRIFGKKEKEKQEYAVLLEGFRTVEKAGYPKNGDRCIYIWENSISKEKSWQTGIYDNISRSFKVTYGDKVFTTSRNKVVAWKRINAKEGIVEEQQ